MPDTVTRAQQNPSSSRANTRRNTGEGCRLAYASAIPTSSAPPSRPSTSIRSLPRSARKFFSNRFNSSSTTAPAVRRSVPPASVVNGRDPNSSFWNSLRSTCRNGKPLTYTPLLAELASNGTTSSWLSNRPGTNDSVAAASSRVLKIRAALSPASSRSGNRSSVTPSDAGWLPPGSTSPRSSARPCCSVSPPIWIDDTTTRPSRNSISPRSIGSSGQPATSSRPPFSRSCPPAGSA